MNINTGLKAVKDYENYAPPVFTFRPHSEINEGSEIPRAARINIATMKISPFMQKALDLWQEQLAQHGLYLTTEELHSAKIQELFTYANSPDAKLIQLGGIDAVLSRSKPGFDTETAALARATPGLDDIFVLGHGATGTDATDSKACYQNGISVLRSPTENGEAVVNLTFTAVDAFLNKLVKQTEDHFQGKFDKEMRESIEGLNMLVIGTGNIGSQIAEEAKRRGVSEVMVFDVNSDQYVRYALDDDQKFQIIAEGQENLIRAAKKANIVTVHASLSAPGIKKEDNIGLISRDFIKAIGQEVEGPKMLINFARSQFIKESDIPEIVAAIDQHGLHFATDVYPEEQPNDFQNPYVEIAKTQGVDLEKMKGKVIFTSHIGGNTEKAQRLIAVNMIKNLSDLLLCKQVWSTTFDPLLIGKDQASVTLKDRRNAIMFLLESANGFDPAFRAMLSARAKVDAKDKEKLRKHAQNLQRFQEFKINSQEEYSGRVYGIHSSEHGSAATVLNGLERFNVSEHLQRDSSLGEAMPFGITLANITTEYPQEINQQQLRNTLNPSIQKSLMEQRGSVIRSLRFLLGNNIDSTDLEIKVPYRI